MTSKKLEIAVTWYNRGQTLKECTEDVIIFLERLKNLDLRLGIWYKTGWSKKEAQKEQIKFEYEYIKNLFYKASKFKDDDFPEFMFDCSIWNGAENDNEAIGLRFSLGGNREHKFGWNGCFIKLPYEGKIREFYNIKGNQEALQELMIDHWKPEFLKINDEQTEVNI